MRGFTVVISSFLLLSSLFGLYSVCRCLRQVDSASCALDRPPCFWQETAALKCNNNGLPTAQCVGWY